MTVRPKSDMLAPKKILELSEFSLPTNNMAKEERTKETTVESLASRVARHPLLAGIDQKQLTLLTESAMAVEFKKGEVIFREGELADRFFLFESGKVVMKSSAGPGDPMLRWLGILHLIPGAARHMPSSQLPPSSFTRHSCASIARKITLSATSF